jgi:DUF4097 and DUF4098 domain-containing protein YvlB
MTRTRFSAIDILGITLGVLAILIVVGSLVAIAQGRMFEFRWSIPEGQGFWNGQAFSIGGSVREERDEQVPTDVTELEVRTVAGSIDVSGNAAAAVVAAHSVKSAPSQAAMDRVRVDIRKVGSRLILEERHEPGFSLQSGTVSFQIVVPRAVKIVEAHSISGSVTVRGVDRTVDQVLSSTSGSVTTNASRNLDASSTSGHVEFASAGNSVKVHTVSGSIDGTIDALDKNGAAVLGSVSGSVTLNAFSQLDAAVTLHSVSGSVSCGFPITISEQKRNRLEGTIGKGSASLDVGTVSGSITINRE